MPADWDDEVVFEGFDPRTPLQFFGGDLDGVIEHLDHLADVGVSVVYTTPVFPGESNHRYNASTFDRVDPLLGGDEAYIRLGRRRARARLADPRRPDHQPHRRHPRVVRRRRATSTGAPARSFYYFLPDGSYECWMGHGTLPKLNHADPALRTAMVDGPDSIVARWLRPPYDLDGWRIDVANMTGRLGAIDVNHDVARLVRRTAEAERADAFVIGEHNHDASADLDGDGWHGTMNYSGFSWPVWSWLRDPASPARAFGRPAPVATPPRRTACTAACASGRAATAGGPPRRRGTSSAPTTAPGSAPSPGRGRRAPGRGRAAVHAARRPDALRRRRDRLGGRATARTPAARSRGPHPEALGRRHAGDVRRARAAAPRARGAAPRRAALGARRRRRPRLPARAPGGLGPRRRPSGGGPGDRPSRPDRWGSATGRSC